MLKAWASFSRAWTKSLADFLPYGRHDIDESDVAAVVDVLQGDWLTTGPTIDRLESAFVEVTGARHSVACSSGSAALHAASFALDLSPSDAVVVPSVTFLATATAPAMCGAEIVFADVDPATGLMTSESFARALDTCDQRGWRPRAVFPVHLNGQCVDVPAISTTARSREMMVVEDACHVLGGTTLGSDGGYHASGACADSDMTIFSLHPVKVVAAGEGGVITTNQEKLAEQARRFVHHGMSRNPKDFIGNDGFSPDGEPNPWYYEFIHLAPNYRISDLHAGLAVAQLRRLQKFVDRRAELVAHYRAKLAPFAPSLIPLPVAETGEPSWHLMVVLVDFEGLGRHRAQVMKALRDKNIGSQVHYRPLHQQRYWRERYGVQTLEGAEEYYRRCLSVPLFPRMSREDVERVVSGLAEGLGLT